MTDWRTAMTWRSELEAIIEAVPPDQMPDLVAELARLDVLARQRLVPQNNGVIEDGRLLTQDEVAERLQKSTRWVQRHAEELRGKAIGRTLRFRPRDIERYIDRQGP